MIDSLPKKMSILLNWRVPRQNMQLDLYIVLFFINLMHKLNLVFYFPFKVPMSRVPKLELPKWQSLIIFTHTSYLNCFTWVHVLCVYACMWIYKYMYIHTINDVCMCVYIYTLTF